MARAARLAAAAALLAAAAALLAAAVAGHAIRAGRKWSREG